MAITACSGPTTTSTATSISALTGVQKEGMHWLLRNLLPSGQAARGLNVRVLDPTGRFTLQGAEVRVQTRGGTGRTAQLVDAGSGYNSQNDAPVHVALPAGTTTITVSVRVNRQGRQFHATWADVDPARFRGRAFEIKVPSTNW